MVQLTGFCTALDSALRSGKAALITTYVSQMEPHLHEHMDSDLARNMRRGFWDAGMRKAKLV
ncbi:hypothetical protein DMH04_08030 [Kibdelosporangium aridum]|uniref:Uncharacterized protein n=1 Tax=Kibdelosporangium aridum TaxID=2030 RepID=A0A428ZKF1_KIBAR|nr:hypothetical protein [Kibdelosporangium aridum]RSM88576.1 hypothetical protein DMH04_08030 [Kibdelosporangium aridum]